VFEHEEMLIQPEYYYFIRNIRLVD